MICMYVWSSSYALCARTNDFCFHDAFRLVLCVSRALSAAVAFFFKINQARTRAVTVCMTDDYGEWQVINPCPFGFERTTLRELFIGREGERYGATIRWYRAQFPLMQA